MQAAFFEQHGGPEVLKYGELKDPKAAPGEVIVGVKACAMNHLDIWARIGLPGVPIPLPHILGADVCGVVLETAPDVPGFQMGDRVIISPGQLPETAVKDYEGRDSYSPEFRILGLQTQGGYAEKVAVPMRWVVRVSDKYNFEEWASFPLVSLTAYHMLVTRANLQKGETVLVHAAGSGVGSVAIQLAKHLGARVITTVGDEKKVSRAKSLGADEVILYKTEDFAEKVNKISGGKGIEVVFDHIGPDTWPKNLKCLARGGRLVTCGSTSGPKSEVEVRFLFSKQLSILGAYMGSFAELRSVLDIIQKGAIKPVIDEIFPLKDARKAHERMESRKNFGKIILKP